MKLNIYRIEFRRAFRNRRFWIVFLLALVSFGVGRIRIPRFDEFGDPNAFNLWMLILDFGFFQYVAPLLATLPYADSLLTDRRQGYLNLVSLRCPFRRYLGVKVAANACAGAAALALPVLLLFLFLYLAAPLKGTSLANVGYPIDPLNFLYRQPLLYFVYLITLVSLFGAVYATLGLAISTVIYNPHVVLMAPFVFFCVASYLVERSIHLAVVGRPVIAMLPYLHPTAPFWQIAVQYATLIFFCLVCLWAFGRKTRLINHGYSE